MVVSPVGLDEIVQVLEIGESHRGRDFGHLPVRPRVDHVVVTREAEIAHEAHFLGELVVVGDDRAAFERIEELGGVKAEDFAFAEAAQKFAAVRTSEAV